MKALVIAIFFVLSTATLPAQTPIAAGQSQKPSPVSPPPETDRSERKPSSTFEAGFLKTDFGFSSTYPTDWQDLTATLPSQMTKQLKKMESEKDPAYMLARRRLECRQPVLRVQHGNPASFITVIAFPHACTKSDAKAGESAFILGAAMGSCSNTPSKYDIKDTLQGAYRVGGAAFVIEKSVGSPKDHPEMKVTLERVCGWLKSAEVFWQAELRDEEAVKVFEGALTSIDGAAPSPLVPPSAIAKLHRPYTGQKLPNPPQKKSTAATAEH